MITINGNELATYLEKSLKEKIEKMKRDKSGRLRRSDYGFAFRLDLYSWIERYFKEKGFAVLDSYNSYSGSRGPYSKLKVRKDSSEGEIKIMEHARNVEIYSEMTGKREVFSRESLSKGNKKRYWRKPILEMGNWYFSEWYEYKALVWIFDPWDDWFDDYDYSAVLFPIKEFNVVVKRTRKDRSMDYVLGYLI